MNLTEKKIFLNNNKYTKIELLKNCNYVKNKFLISVIVPVFNKEKKIEHFVNCLTGSMTQDYELIFINDFSNDKSLSKLIQSCQLINIPYKIFNILKKPLFETKCDMLGFLFSKGNYLLEIQSDIFISDTGFDKRMIDCFEKFPNLSSLSGRSCHSWEDILTIKDKLKSFFNFKNIKFFSSKYNTSIGDAGRKVFDKIEKKNHEIGSLFIGDTNCRGPWMVRKDIFFKYGAFDYHNFFLGGDDHDFNLRSKQQGNLIAGYTPVLFQTYPEDGSCRQERNGINKNEFDKLILEKKGFNILKKKILKENWTIPKKINL